MNKKILLTVLGIVVLITGAVLYVLLNRASNDDAASETVPGGQMVQETRDESDVTPGEYREYSEEAVLNTPGTKLIFFHAAWCPQCRAIEDSIKKDGLPEGVTVFKIDYDSNQGLRQKYGVTLQTTFIKIDDTGNKIDSYVAYEEPVFSSVERELLK